MTKTTKVILIASGVLVAGGSYFFYRQMKNAAIDKRVSSLQEVEEIIKNIETETDEIEPTEPTLPEMAPDSLMQSKLFGSNEFGDFGDFGDFGGF